MVFPDIELEFEMLVYVSEKNGVKFHASKKSSFLDLWLGSDCHEYDGDYTSSEWGENTILIHNCGRVADRLMLEQ